MSGLTNEQIVLPRSSPRRATRGSPSGDTPSRCTPTRTRRRCARRSSSSSTSTSSASTSSRCRRSRSAAGSSRARGPAGRRRSSRSARARRSRSSREPKSDGRQEVQADERRSPPDGHVVVRGDHALDAGEVAARAAQEDGRAERERPHHDPPPGRRAQAPLPEDRLQARQGRRAGEGRLDRVRPEPLGPDRAAPLRGRREGVHPRPARAPGRRDGPGGPRRRHQARERAAARRHPDRHVVHAVELRPGQGAKLARSAGSGIQLVAKDAPYGVLRLPSGEMRRVLLTCRATVGPGRELRPRERVERQGRPQPLAGQAAVRTRHGDEPGRPSRMAAARASRRATTR